VAKLSAGGAKVIAQYSDEKGHRLNLRSDGAILRQFRIDGRLERATIIGRIRKDRDFHEVFARVAKQRGYLILEVPRG
jgi:hypothetical protein